MPQAAIQSSSTPPLPPGYALDSAGAPPLPPGYALDSAQTPPASTQQAAAPPGGIAGAWNKFKSAVQGPINISGFPNISRQANEVKDMATGAVKGMSEMTAPSMAGELYNRLTGQPNTLKQLPGKIVTQGVPLILGDPEADAGETAARPAPQAPAAAAPAAPAPKPGPTLPGILARHIPIVGKVLRGMDTVNELKTLFSKSAEPAPAPPAPKPSAQPIPETNGIPWGSGGKGPLDMRGKMIPQAQEPLPDQPSAQAAPEQPAPVNTQAATPQPSAQPAAPNGKSTIKNDLERLLNQATGGKPLESGVPLKNQGRPQTNLQQQIADSAEPSKQTPKAPLTDLQGQIADAANPLPEGVTPVGSSFLRGYKYDPDKQEFSVFLKNGDHHDFGQVSPEQVKAFLDAKSQGSAFTKEIKNGAGVVPLRKNGKPVNPSTPHTSGDLMPQLQQMLKNAIATKK